MEIVAHRGASADAPENTLAAVRLAWEQAADAVEIDVHLAADGELMVIHDDDTLRVAGKPGKVAARTLAELRALDVGAWKGPQWTGEKIPTFDEVLAAVPEGKKLFVEAKCGAEAVGKIQESIRRLGGQPGQVVIIGFSLATMRAAKAAMPGNHVSWLVKMSRDQASGVWRPAIDELIAQAMGSGLDGLSINSTEAIGAALVARLRAAGMTLNVWTVDDPVTAKRLQMAGIDYLSTNRPGWIRGQLAAR